MDKVSQYTKGFELQLAVKDVTSWIMAAMFNAYRSVLGMLTELW